MPVTIVNKVPDLREREDLNLTIEELLDSSPVSWNVRVLPEANSDNIAVRAHADSQTFMTRILGASGNSREVLRNFIHKAVADVEEAGRSGQATTPKKTILKKFQLLSGTPAGIESWITAKTDEQVFIRLNRIDTDPLSKVQLNQLLLLAHEAGVSDGFFRYYWLSAPVHPYDVTTIPGYDRKFIQSENIESLPHLIWGLYRLYVDALLYFGNIRSCYRFLRSRSEFSSDFHSLGSDQVGATTLLFQLALTVHFLSSASNAALDDGLLFAGQFFRFSDILFAGATAQGGVCQGQPAGSVHWIVEAARAALIRRNGGVLLGRVRSFFR
jgi:hypothetical protein